jgi:hypothetical protein
LAPWAALGPKPHHLSDRSTGSGRFGPKVDDGGFFFSRIVGEPAVSCAYAGSSVDRTAGFLPEFLIDLAPLRAK